MTIINLQNNGEVWEKLPRLQPDAVIQLFA
jgi:hypothetical protein